jgi:hypothetical protein
MNGRRKGYSRSCGNISSSEDGYGAHCMRFVVGFIKTIYWYLLISLLRLS